jgi:peptidoglycan/LPS O-acetylase OafA/YrhL
LATYLLLFLCAPIAILIGSRTELSGTPQLQNIANSLGKLSYPLYITHYPIINIVHLLLKDRLVSSSIEISLYVTATILFAAPLVVYEQKLRNVAFTILNRKRST